MDAKYLLCKVTKNDNKSQKFSRMLSETFVFIFRNNLFLYIGFLSCNFPGFFFYYCLQVFGADFRVFLYIICHMSKETALILPF